MLYGKPNSRVLKTVQKKSLVFASKLIYFRNREFNCDRIIQSFQEMFLVPPWPPATMTNIFKLNQINLKNWITGFIIKKRLDFEIRCVIASRIGLKGYRYSGMSHQNGLILAL